MLNHPVIKKLILYDEECAFCRNAAAYWEQVAKDQVNVFTAKTGVDSEYDFLSGGTLDAVTLIEGSGEIFADTGAVIRLMKIQGSHVGSALWGLNEKVALFRLVAKCGYRMVARHRCLIPTR